MAKETGKEKLDLPKYCYQKGNKIWFTMKNEKGEWVNRSTPYTIFQPDLAGRYVKAILRGEEQRKADAAKGMMPDMTVRAYATRWVTDRENRDIITASQDRSRLEKHVLPFVGDLSLIELRPRHARDMVRGLRDRSGKAKMAPRSIIHAYRLLHSLMESAVVDELVEYNPVKISPGELPRKVDGDREWRANATYTVAEVERLISDPLIPAQRRVQYAFKALAGMRHGEVAALCWRHLDYTFEPLAKINVVQAYSAKKREVKSTKMEETRQVPMHPVLARIVKAWRDDHWERVYGRKLTDDDFVVPTRTFWCVHPADAGHAMADDLVALGLRPMAGKKRRRGGHDLRSWYETRTVEDDADSMLIRRTTHAAPKDVIGGYHRFSWETLCREVAKLSVKLSDEQILPVLTDSLPLEQRAGERWKNSVTPKGLERMRMSAHSRSKHPHLDDDSSKHSRRSGSSREGTVRRRPYSLALLSKLAEAAIRAGDHARALRILNEIRKYTEEVKETGHVFVKGAG